MSKQVIKDDPKTIKGWAFFDWANSSYNLVISTAVFPPFFTAVAPKDMELFGNSISSSSLYSYAVSFSFLIVAFLIPILSGIADHSGRRLLFLKIFTVIGATACASMFFFKDANSAWFGLNAFMIGTIGFSAGLVFYNAFLPIIASHENFDKVSAKGYAYGYVGSVFLLIFILAMIQEHNPLRQAIYHRGSKR